MAESTGVPLPGETILVSAGVLVQRGRLDLGDTIIFGILGAIVGDQIGYWAGREGGRPFILRYGRYVWITPQRLGRAEAFFARHGGKAVFLARYFSGLRVFGALVAGMSRMPWGTFILYNAFGAAVWATSAVLAGYFLGSSLGVVDRWTGQASILLLAFAVLALVLYLSYRWETRHQERVKEAIERIGGHHVYAFLESLAEAAVLPPWGLRPRPHPRARSHGSLLLGLRRRGAGRHSQGPSGEDGSHGAALLPLAQRALPHHGRERARGHLLARSSPPGGSPRRLRPLAAGTQEG